MEGREDRKYEMVKPSVPTVKTNQDDIQYGTMGLRYIGCDCSTCTHLRSNNTKSTL